MPDINLNLTKAEFEARLKEKYNGTLKPMKPFVSDRITMFFKCNLCKESFFARPSYLLEIESQSHICGMPYGSMNGERVSQVMNSKSKRKKKNKPKAKAEKVNPNLKEEVDRLLAEGFTASKTATKLGVNPSIIKDYANHWRHLK